VVAIDVTGGEVDRLLHDPDVATILNDRFNVSFLHPRALPHLTARVGWPALAVLAPDGCLRAWGSPSDVGDAIALLNDGLRAVRDDTVVPFPAVQQVRPAPGGGDWSEPDPRTATTTVRYGGVAYAIPLEALPATCKR
jgi:hypothetical protein